MKAGFLESGGNFLQDRDVGVQRVPLLTLTGRELAERGGGVFRSLFPVGTLLLSLPERAWVVTVTPAGFQSQRLIK